MSRVVHFEIHADQPERAVAFYEKVFGWSVTKWNGPEEYWLLTTGAPNTIGINGGLMRRRGPDAHVFNTIEVTSVDKSVTAIEAGGGTMVVPKFPIPGVGWLAYFKDTEENIFGIMEPDMAAGQASAPPFRANGGIITLFVRDVQRSVAFYTEKLGAMLEYPASDEWALVNAGRGLLIGLHGTSHNPSLPSDKNVTSIGFDVPCSIDKARADLEQKGIVFAGPVVNDGSVKLAHFADPDGNPLYLCEVVKS